MQRDEMASGTVAAAAPTQRRKGTNVETDVRMADGVAQQQQQQRRRGPMGWSKLRTVLQFTSHLQVRLLLVWQQGRQHGAMHCSSNH